LLPTQSPRTGQNRYAIRRCTDALETPVAQFAPLVGRFPTRSINQVASIYREPFHQARPSFYLAIKGFHFDNTSKRAISYDNNAGHMVLLQSVCGPFF
jgi:hypothetical protein